MVPKSSWDKWGEITRLQQRGETTLVTHWNKIFYGPFIGVIKASNWHPCITTVDGWNPAPFDSLSQYLQGSIHPRWCRISAINSRMLRAHLGTFVSNFDKPSRAFQPWLLGTPDPPAWQSLDVPLRCPRSGKTLPKSGAVFCTWVWY